MNYFPIVNVSNRIAVIWEFEEDRILWDEDERHYYVTTDDEDYNDNNISPITEIAYLGNGEGYTHVIFYKKQLFKSLRAANRGLMKLVFYK